jgi:hypothetical protein
MGLRMQLSSGVPLQRIPVMLDAYKVGLSEGGYAFSSENVLLSRIAHIEATREKAWEVGGPPYEWFRKMVAEVTPPPGVVSTRNSSPLPQFTGPVGQTAGDPGYFFCTPDEATRCLQDISAMGIGTVIFQGNWGGIAQEDAVRSIRLLGKEVLPHFSSGAK